MIELLGGEEVITKSDDGSVVLTNVRVCYEGKVGGQTLMQRIMLEHITSIESYKSSKKSFLYLAIMVGLFSAVAYMEWGDNLAYLLLVVGIVLFLLFWLSRVKSIVISSPSSKIKLQVSNMSDEAISTFINKVEGAIHNMRNSKKANV